MAEPNTYTLGGFQVYDVDGVPHYTHTKTKLKRDATGKPITPFYKLDGYDVYDVDGVPHYSATGKKVTTSGTDGAPQKPETAPPVVADDDEDKGDTRTNQNGIVQKGMTLGGIKDFNAAYGLEVADASKLFNLNGTNGQTADNHNDFSAGDARVMGKPLKESIPIRNGGATETVITAEGIGETTPYTLGQTDNPQNGVSDKPDSADLTRGLSFKTGRTGRRDPRNRGGGANEPFGGEEPSNSSLVSPMYADKARNAYRSGFLDSTAKGPMGVLRDASANQGVIRTNDGGISIKDGDGYRTYTGNKSAREVAFDLGGGQKGYDKHATNIESIGVPDKSEIQSDDEQTPATVQPEWNEMNMEQKKGVLTDSANAFAASYVQRVKDKNK